MTHDAKLLTSHVVRCEYFRAYLISEPQNWKTSSWKENGKRFGKITGLQWELADWKGEKVVKENIPCSRRAAMNTNNLRQRLTPGKKQQSGSCICHSIQKETQTTKNAQHYPPKESECLSLFNQQTDVFTSLLTVSRPTSPRPVSIHE